MSMKKVAVITAAGSGMGAATARRLAQDGYNVAILSSSGKGEVLADELGGIGVTGSNLVASDMQRLVDMTMARWGRIDALVNSAGHGPRAPILDISDDDWHQGMEVYFLSAVRAIRMVTPIMEAQGKGAIVNISTAWVTQPTAMFPTSTAFRASLAAFVRIFAEEYSAKDIRINNVLPGWIDSLPELDERREGVPMARYGKAEEIAATIAFLLSDGAGYITGQGLRVDGGVIRQT
ncbi:MAG: SDR family oxidoreductase [Pseudomonadota bacterium]|nr:SDR family oxidoreductase [Pseudomonadota bacterium]